MKKLTALFLSLLMLLSMSITAFAATGGTITINNAHDGETYKIYKLLDLSLDAEKGAYTYTLPANSPWENFFKDDQTGAQWFAFDETSRVITARTTLTETSKYDFAAAALKYLDESDPAIDALQTVGASNETVTFNDLDLGYYFINTTVGTAVVIETNDVNLTINDKSASPRVDKQVQEDSTGAWGNENTAGQLETVNYKVELSAIQGLHHVDLRDTLSAGLTFDPDSVKVYRNEISDATLVQGETVNSTTGKYETIGYEGSWYLVDATHESPDYGTDHLGSHTFHIHFRDSYTSSIDAGEKLIITYSATVNENAVIAGEGNPNMVTLGYGNNQEIVGDTVKTYVWELPILKYTKTATNSTTPLAGAKFIVYSNTARTTTTYVKSVDENGMITELTSNRAEAYQFESGADGKIKVSGLDSDTYYVEEVEAPVGYNILTAPIMITISQEGVIRTSGDAQITELQIENKTGTELPSTGGFGTTLFITVGMFGVLFFGVLMVTNKRMKKEGF